MSYDTEADRARDRAVDFVKEAIEEVFSIVNEDVDGLDQYSEQYKQKLNDSLLELLNIKIRLK